MTHVILCGDAPFLGDWFLISFPWTNHLSNSLGSSLSSVISIRLNAAQVRNCDLVDFLTIRALETASADVIRSYVFKARLVPIFCWSRTSRLGWGFFRRTVQKMAKNIFHWFLCHTNNLYGTRVRIWVAFNITVLYHATTLRGISYRRGTFHCS